MLLGMQYRLLPLLALGVLASACGASAPPRSLEAYRIVSQSTDPATGQVIYHGVAEDGSGATVQIYGGQGQVAVARSGPAPLVRRAPAFRRHRRMWRRHAMRREAMRQRMAQRWQGRRGRHHAHRGPHGPGCR